MAESEKQVAGRPELMTAIVESSEDAIISKSLDSVRTYTFTGYNN
jgi:hypothetical protein